jgi:DNA-binding NarL/FixJ family response regulator
MLLLLVEDDPLQSSLIQEILKQEWNKAVIEILETEAEFRAQIPSLAERNPDVIIMDVMLRWTQSSENIELMPEDVIRDGYFRAGLRCQKLLVEAGINVPVILFTVLETRDLGDKMPIDDENVAYLGKGSDFTPLKRKIRQLTTKRRAR